MLKLKWYHLYYFLAVFGVLAVSGSLLMNHQLMDSYGQSIEVNQSWANRLKALSDLRDIVIEVNATGHDVFGDSNALLHKSHRDAAYINYISKMQDFKNEILDIEQIKIHDVLENKLFAIDNAMYEMVGEADLIFTFLNTGKMQLASSRMVMMNRKNGLLLSEINRLSYYIQSIQKENLDAQILNSSRLKKFEDVIAVAIILMVILVAFYGRKLAYQMRMVENDREQNHKLLHEQAEIISDSERRGRAIFDAVADGIIILDINGNIESINPAVTKYFGYSSQELVGENFCKLIPSQKVYDNCILPGRDNHNEKENETIIQELMTYHKDGAAFNIALTISSFEHSGERKFTAVVRDITELKKSQDRINKLAMTDPLTGLSNRNTLASKFKEIIDHDLRNKAITALMLLDMDRFKFVNDSYGHQIGDKLLIEVSSRLQSIFRDTDLLVRLGGDEFAIVLSNLTTVDSAAVLAERVIKLLGEPFYFDGLRIDSGVSIGLSASPQDDSSLNELLRKSDLALYAAKGKGGETYQFYKPKMQRHLIGIKNTEIKIKYAIENQEFKLFYQPQIDIQNNKLRGVEALIRWHDPVRGIVAPYEFIPIAEKSALIFHIGEWVLHESIQQWHRWQKQGLGAQFISINASAKEFGHQKFSENVCNALAEAEMPGKYLEIELTETAALEDINSCVKKIEKLKEMGISFAIDDFGTGHSSLTYLNSMPIDCVKIDRSFVSDLVNCSTKAIITESVIKLANKLGMAVVAEGVEDIATAKQLSEMGCTLMQGYLYSKPMPSEDFNKWFNENYLINSDNQKFPHTGNFKIISGKR